MTKRELELGRRFEAEPGDPMLILSGDASKTRKQLERARLEMGARLGRCRAGEFSVLWVVDFPLLEYGEEEQRWLPLCTIPFTSPKLRISCQGSG